MMLTPPPQILHHKRAGAPKKEGEKPPTTYPRKNNFRSQTKPMHPQPASRPPPTHSTYSKKHTKKEKRQEPTKKKTKADPRPCHKREKYEPEVTKNPTPPFNPTHTRDRRCYFTRNQMFCVCVCGEMWACVGQLRQTRVQYGFAKCTRLCSKARGLWIPLLLRLLRLCRLRSSLWNDNLVVDRLKRRRVRLPVDAGPRGEIELALDGFPLKC